MFKIQVSSIIYYYENEDTYNYCNNIKKHSIARESYIELLQLCTICIDTAFNNIIKNQAYPVQNLVEDRMDIEKAKKH